MTVKANGKEYELPEGAMLSELLELRNMSINSTAVWINGRQPMYSEYSALQLHDGDELKLYHMCIGG